MFAFAIKTRACAHSSSTSMFVGLVVTLNTIMRKVTGSNPIVNTGTFLPVPNTQSQRSPVQYLVTAKKNQLFRFRLCPCLAGDPVIKLFSQLNPAHRGRAKCPGIVDLARITASSATAPAELKLSIHGPKGLRDLG